MVFSYPALPCIDMQQVQRNSMATLQCLGVRSQGVFLKDEINATHACDFELVAGALRVCIEMRFLCRAAYRTDSKAVGLLSRWHTLRVGVAFFSSFGGCRFVVCEFVRLFK